MANIFYFCPSQMDSSKALFFSCFFIKKSQTKLLKSMEIPENCEAAMQHWSPLFLIPFQA